MGCYSPSNQRFKASGKRKLNVGHIPIHSGYFVCLLVWVLTWVLDSPVKLSAALKSIVE